jgi:Arabinose efflux permease
MLAASSISNIFERVKDGFISLKSPNFRKFFIGQTTSFIGSWIQNIGMGWLVYRLTGSVALLGVVSFSSQIPALIVTPFAGVFADKLNRKTVMLVTQSLMMLIALLFAVLTLTNTITVALIIILSIINGVVVAFDTPFRHSILSDLVDKEHLSNAVALNSIMVNASRLVGPAIAGLLIAGLGEGICFLINSLSFLAIIISLMVIDIKIERPEKLDLGIKAINRELLEGIQYARSNAGFKNIFMIVFLSSLLCLPVQSFMPAYAKDIFKGDSETLGLFTGLFGMGALIGAIILGQVRSPLSLVKMIGIAGLMLSGGIILFSFTSYHEIATIALPIAGFGMINTYASANTLIQVYSKSELRGRMVSLYNVSFLGLTPIGSLILGFFAQYFGIQETMVISSFIFMAVAVSFLIRHKFVKRKIQYQ